MKKFITIIFLLLICSCTKKSNYDYTIKTIIEENTNTVIAINYPITNIVKINKELKKYVNNTYDTFLKNYNTISYLDKKHELNIDYTYYNLDNHYISTILFKHISSTDQSLVLNEVFNYVYDIKKQKQIKFTDILEDDEKDYIKSLICNLLVDKYSSSIDISKIANIDYENLNFSFSGEYVNIYFEGKSIANNNNILEINIPLTYFEKLQNLNIKKNIENVTNYIEPNINYIDIEKPVVALTFDDGPSKYTKEILETLKQNNSNATFFVLGNKIDDYSDTIIEMYNMGNEIGNHSYNHRWLTKLSEEEQREQIDKTQDVIKKYIGTSPIYLRPTYGSVNSKLRKNTNLEIILWNVDTKDWKYKKVDTIINNALKNVKDGSIILMHDTYQRTSEAVKILVPQLIKDGYQLVTISELKEVQKIKNKLNEKR